MTMSRESLPPSRTLPTREGYDRWAEIYDTDGNPLIVLEEREIAPLLADVRGLDILDVGCGAGRHALPLAAKGARVTAVDFSEGMLARARAKPGAERIRFIHADLSQEKPLPVPDQSFDRVLCCLVVDHIAALEPLFREMRRACRDDGFILLTVMHPAMLLRGVSARFTDPATGHEIRPASVPNQISDYVSAALRANLTITHISEHAADEALAAAAPRAQKHLGWPLLLVMRMGPGER